MRHLIPWFRLKNVPGIGNHLYKRLLDRFGLPENVFNAPKNELLDISGITPQILSAISDPTWRQKVEREIQRIAKSPFHVLTYTDTSFPALLREIPDPPPILYVYGTLQKEDAAIAIVGSRSATNYGLNTARSLSAEMASLGVTIVSGMARGVDTSAHLGALDARGRTIAVLGSGLGCIYPPENAKLFHQIARNGAVISEFSIDATPEAYHFPARNRIISGLSLGTVVVEAALKSGSLITARLAAEQNREVFAVPGSIRSYKSQGTHNLIKQGAKLVEKPSDIFDELATLRSFSKDGRSESLKTLDEINKLTTSQKKVLKTLSPYPQHLDLIVGKLSMAMGVGEITAHLLQLELYGLITKEPGNRYVINH